MKDLRTKKQFIVRGIISLLLGAALLSLLVTLQNYFTDSPINLITYIVPVLFGGITGAIIGIWDLRLRNLIRERDAYEQTLHETIAKRTAQLHEMNFELSRQALYDGLTNIRNYRDYKKRISDEWERWRRGRGDLSVIMCDIDYFKAYNDTYGHLKGDECLKTVADALKSVIKRPNDYLARYGGEEFILILPGTDLEGALQMAENARKAVYRIGIEHKASGSDDVVTVSMGVASTQDVDISEGYSSLVAAADEALYEAKDNGRNQVYALELAS